MRRSHIGVFIHLVWATWDRLPLLTPDAEHQAYRVIGNKCKELDVDMIAIGGMPDHVHLVIRLPATLTIAHVAKHVKGASGHLLARQAEERHEFFKWQGAYGAFSVSPHELPKITRYIAHQKQHHAANILFPDWELTDEEDPQ